MRRFNWLKWVLLALVFLSTTATDDDEIDPDEVEEGDDSDYSRPGVPTENCVCVPFYQCEKGEIVSDGSNLIDPRKKTQDEEVPMDEQYLPPSCGPYHVCCRDPESRTVEPYEHRCGIRNPSGINARILTSQAVGEAEFGEWPWQALILEVEGDDFIFKCGGTLIDSTHVLTVAHCADKFLDNMANAVVRLGEWDAQNEDEFMPHEDFGVSDITIHEKYRANNLFNDIAILTLDREVKFKPHIDSVCLPREDDDFTGQDCIVTGWGSDAYQGGEFSMIMKEVSVPVLSNDDCQERLRKTRLGRYFKLYDGFLCAGGKKGEDSCKGDGGGPLVCYRPDNSYTLAGIVSWGIECGTEGVPGVYVNIRKYVNWIISNTGKPLEEYLS